ncbi:YceI family protein [Paenirhodobacter sp. CAU 1674]|uniref:YceI family protein n=1 Tax=Paenirhodobacter sp. CAU 1674 TaxID=3032596 RepID=UPI0023DBCAE8|nr:YceI family protein [Paenirhodobacter sp. CAU 1674]MDF2141348.1 YceI family protein [Paenirhodobacter sp. CAU 1674]
MRAPLLALTLALMPLAPAWAGPQIEPAPTLAPAGDYHLDPAHARLMFRVNHLGFSNYTAFFRDFDAQLTFDPVDPQAMVLQASVDPASVETLFPDPGFDFNAVIAGPQFLDAAQFPEMRFDSTKITLTAPDRAALSGLLTLHGVTRPVTLRVTFNGGYGGHPMDPGGARVGFSATGTLFRSDFGIGFGIPEPGSSLGVSDAVEIVIEAEFINPAASGVQVGP